MAQQVKTDNKWHQMLCGSQLTEKELEEFDWMDKAQLESAMFFKHEDMVIALSECSKVEDEELKGSWDRFYGLHAWAAIVVQYRHDGTYRTGLLTIS